MSEHTSQPENNETTMPQPRMSNPDDERKPRKIGCMVYAVVVIIFLTSLVWFNLLRQGPPLRISKETTYITEPLTPDGRHVDYFAALQQMIHPPEMQTDENGYRVVFRALGDFNNETGDFFQLQKRYEALGLDVIRDKPTMTYIDPYGYFSKRFESHPEEFEDFIEAEQEKRFREQEKNLRKEIENIKADTGLSEEEKARRVAEVEEDIEALSLSFEDRKTRQREAMQAQLDEINNDENLSADEKRAQSFQVQLSAMSSMERSYDPYQTFRSLSDSLQLHEDAIARKWLEENNAALDLVAEQVKKPIFVTPYFATGERPLLIAMLLPDAQSMRSLARGFDARALIRLGDGDIGGAIDDIIACYQLGRHIEKKGTLVEGLVGIALEGIAGHLPYDMGPETRPTTEQLKHLRDELLQLSPQKGFLHKMEIERYTCLNAMQSVMLGGSVSDFSYGGSVSPLDDMMPFSGLDWNIIFENVNHAYDGILAGTYVYSPPPTHLGRRLTLRARSNLMADIFIGLFLPAVDAANEAYRRLECVMNMKRVVLAMHLYEREHGTLPPAFTVDENGKPLHGWRTLLLPYFGDETLVELHSQIRFDEPWDSAHNRQFHERNIDVYRCPSATKSDGESNYSVITGDELLFTTDGEGQPLDKCGLIMLLLVERKDGVCWMQPATDLTQADAEKGVNREFSTGGRWAPGGPLAPVGSNHTGGACFGLRDGGITFLSDTIEESVFRNLVRGTANERP